MQKIKSFCNKELLNVEYCSPNRTFQTAYIYIGQLELQKLRNLDRQNVDFIKESLKKIQSSSEKRIQNQEDSKDDSKQKMLYYKPIDYTRELYDNLYKLSKQFDEEEILDGIEVGIQHQIVQRFKHGFKFETKSRQLASIFSKQWFSRFVFVQKLSKQFCDRKLTGHSQTSYEQNSSSSTKNIQQKNCQQEQKERVLKTSNDLQNSFEAPENIVNQDNNNQKNDNACLSINSQPEKQFDSQKPQTQKHVITTNDQKLPVVFFQQVYANKQEKFNTSFENDEKKIIIKVQNQSRKSNDNLSKQYQEVSLSKKQHDFKQLYYEFKLKKKIKAVNERNVSDTFQILKQQKGDNQPENQKKLEEKIQNDESFEQDQQNAEEIAPTPSFSVEQDNFQTNNLQEREKSDVLENKDVVDVSSIQNNTSFDNNSFQKDPKLQQSVFQQKLTENGQLCVNIIDSLNSMKDFCQSFMEKQDSINDNIDQRLFFIQKEVFKKNKEDESINHPKKQ